MAFQWQVTYTDGSVVTNREQEWTDISHPVPYDGLILHVLTGEATSLSAGQGDCVYTLYAPEELGTRFYRHFRGRGMLGSEISRVYHAIGYISAQGRVLLEIDSHGNAVRHFFPHT